MKREAIENLADLVADNADVDWDRAQAAVESPDDDAVLRQLRVLQTIARVHQTGEQPPAFGAGLDRRAWGDLWLRRRLGQGTYGAVYLAWDPRLEREVALKLLHAGDLGTSGASEVIEEARALARVNHPNVITVYGAERIGGEIGLWMEFIHGSTLAHLIAQAGPFSPAETALIGITLCRALTAVHRAGLLHRDVKAQNVMRERGGRIVLMDFGSVREHGSGADGTDLSGTPLYLAPELFTGGAASVQSDIYSLGVLLYHAVSGDFPVGGGSLDELREAHRARRHRRLQEVRPDAPDAFARSIERALAPDPADRYGTAAEFASDLSQALGFPSAEGETPAPGWRRWRNLVIAALVALAALGTAWALRPERSPDISVQRLTFRSGRVTAARFAPDARTVIYSAEWSGEQRELFSTAFGSVESRTFGTRDASVLAISPQGELALLLRPRFLRGYVEAGTLARVPVGGGTPRELLDDVQEADWTPDGQALAIVREVQGRSRLELPVDTVLYESGGWIGSVRVSPDGERVAFIDHPTLADDSGTVMVVDRSGKRTALGPSWASALGLAWAPSGKEVWFTAAQSGNTRGIYAASLDGRVRAVRQMVSMLRLQDVSKDGRVLVTHESTRVGLRARTPADASERELSWLDWSIVRDLSADGSSMVFNESGEGGGASYGVYVRRVDGSPALKLGEGSGMSISPDGRRVLARRPNGALALLPVGAGEPRVLPGALRYQQWGTWFPDGKRILFAATDGTGASRVYVQDVSGGPPIAISEEGVFLTSADPLSPDGTLVAALGRDQFPTIFPVARGPARRVPGTQPGEIPIHWSHDGRALYVTQRGVAPARVDIVDVTTGSRRRWKELMPTDPTGVHEIIRVVLSADARTYAYSYTRELSILHLIDGLR